MRLRLARVAVGCVITFGLISPARAESSEVAGAPVPRASVPRPKAGAPRPTRPAQPAAPAQVVPAPAAPPASSAAPLPSSSRPQSSKAAPPGAAAPIAPTAFLPPRLPTFRDLPPPPGYVLESHRNWGLVGGGAIIWVGSYIAGLVAAGSDPRGGSGKMAIPLLGPWLALGGRQFSCELDLTLESAQRCQSEAIQETTIVATYAALGVVQILGATLVFTGILDRKESWVRADLASRPRPGTFSVEPVLGTERAGVKLGLTF